MDSTRNIQLIYINAAKKIDIKTFLLGGREHPAKRRNGQTLFVAHAGGNHREGASAVFLLFYVLCAIKREYGMLLLFGLPLYELLQRFERFCTSPDNLSPLSKDVFLFTCIYRSICNP